MNRYLLDTGVLSDYINRRHGIARRVQEESRRGHHIGSCFPAVGELLAGLEMSISRDPNYDQAMRIVKQLICWPYDLKAAKEYGRIFADLRQRGRIIQNTDIQIAAVVLTLPRCTLVTYDSDFANIKGVRIVNWKTG